MWKAPKNIENYHLEDTHVPIRKADRSVGKISLGHTRSASKQSFGISHGGGDEKDRERFRTGLPGRLVCRTSSRSRDSYG